MTRDHHVYYRRADGKGTQTWKSGLTEAEALAEVNWCFGAIKDATMVWVAQDGASTSTKLFLREDVPTQKHAPSPGGLTR